MTGNKRARKWFSVMDFYRESHIDSWYEYVEIRVPQKNSHRSIPWVLRIKAPPTPEWGQKPPSFFQANSFNGICGAIVHVFNDQGLLDPETIDEFLSGCKPLSEDEEVAAAISSWKLSSPR